MNYRQSSLKIHLGPHRAYPGAFCWIKMIKQKKLTNRNIVISPEVFQMNSAYHYRHDEEANQ